MTVDAVGVQQAEAELHGEEEEVGVVDGGGVEVEEVHEELLHPVEADGAQRVDVVREVQAVQRVAQHALQHRRVLLQECGEAREGGGAAQGEGAVGEKEAREAQNGEQVVVVVVEQATAARGPRERLLLRLERLLVVVDVRGHAPRVLGHLEVDVRHQLVVRHALHITSRCEENLEAVSQPLEDEVLDLEEEEADEGLNHRLGVDLAHLGVPGVERVALAVSRRV